MSHTIVILIALADCTLFGLSRRTNARNQVRSTFARSRDHSGSSEFPKYVWEVMSHEPVEPEQGDACAIVGNYKLPPLEKVPDTAGLMQWCADTWPVSDHYASLQSCSKPKALSRTKLTVGTVVSVPIFEGHVDYEVLKELGGGINNQGAFMLKKVSDQNSSFPEHVVLKNIQQTKIESHCLQSVDGIEGFPKILSDTFLFEGGCFKGIVMSAVAGSPWANYFPLEATDECGLQEATGRLMCGLLQRGYAELDWNNPGNWHIEKLPYGETKFHRLDLGLCYSYTRYGGIKRYFKKGFFKLDKFGRYESEQDWGQGNGAGMMWHPKAFKFHLGAGDLILNSQMRVWNLIKTSIQNPPATIVAFPGDFVSQLGGNDWDFNDFLCQGRTSDNGVSYYLDLPNLKAGYYKFKVVLHGNWKYSLGNGDTHSDTHADFIVNDGEHVRLQYLRSKREIQVSLVSK